MGLGLKVIFRTGLGLKRGFLTNKLSCPILRKVKEKRKKSVLSFFLSATRFNIGVT